MSAVTRTVVLEGTRDIMFDRYAGDNKSRLTVMQKLYLDGRRLVLPAANVVSFLTAQNTNSAPKRLRDPRKYKTIANAILSFTDIAPALLPFERNGVPIEFGQFGPDERDELSGVYIHRSVARLDKGIPNPKERPVLPLPWSLRFALTLYPNGEVEEQEIVNLLTEGGRAIGLGTFRGVFGKFRVADWV